MAVDSAIALLHDIGIPRNLDMDHVLAEIVKVDALGRGICGKKDANWRHFAGTRLECVYHSITFFSRKGTMKNHHRLAAVAVIGKDRLKPRMRVHELGEEDYALVVELTIRSLQMLIKPFQNGLRLGV